MKVRVVFLEDRKALRHAAEPLIWLDAAKWASERASAGAERQGVPGGLDDLDSAAQDAGRRSERLGRGRQPLLVRQGQCALGGARRFRRRHICQQAGAQLWQVQGAGLHKEVGRHGIKNRTNRTNRI